MRPLALLLVTVMLAPMSSFAVPGAEPRKDRSDIVLPKELPPLAPEKPLPVPYVRASTLPNGVTSWVVRRSGVPLVNVRVIVRGGRSADPAPLPGFANLLAAALKEGTRTRTGAQLTELLQGIGGELATGAGDDALTVAASGLGARVGTHLDVLADVVRNPVFPAKDVARLRALAEEELATNESDPFFLAQRAFRKAVYGAHPYGAVAPTRSSIAAAVPETLRREALRRLRPERTLVLVVGDVDPKAAAEEIAKAFGGWKAEGEPAPEPGEAAPPPGGPGLRLVARPGSVQTTLVVGNLGLSRRDPDDFALRLANTIYGGAFSSRLVTNLREEKGYTYSPGSSTHALVGRGTVATFAAVRNEVTGAALGEILYEMNRMSTTEPTEEELSRARSRDAGEHVLSLQTNAGLAAALADLWLSGLPPADVNRYVEALPKLGAADVRRVSKKYLASGAARVVAVGDPGVVNAELAPFGPVFETKGGME